MLLDARCSPDTLSRCFRVAVVAPAALAALASCAGARFGGRDQAAATAPQTLQGEGAGDAVASAVTRLRALFEEAWQRQMREHPDRASVLGDRRYDDRWPDNSMAAIGARHAAGVDLLAALKRIDRAALPPDERISYDLFAREYEDAVAGHRFRAFLMPLSHRGGVQSLDEIHEQLRFETESDYRHWLARLAAVGTAVQQTEALLRQGLAEGRVAPRVVMDRIPDQIDAQIVDAPDDSPFFVPFKSFPDGFPAEQRARLRSEARRAISAVVVPAYRSFRRFFVQQYLPRARETVGLWDYPDGKAYYEYLVKHHTTTDMSPGDIHRLGLREVARIRGEMQQVIDQIGFVGGFEAFLDHLRTDPQLYFKSERELLDAYLITCKRIDPELPRLFGRLPRTPYGVRPIPDAVAADSTTAYYEPPAADGSRAGFLYVNLHDLRARPKYEIEVLTAHEAVPGHHLQVALAQELRDLPKFRRYNFVTAFLEGWALYSESLGDTLGLYKDPYSRFGQLTYDMWRAVRLVLDTGIHYFRWDRQRAIDYFRDNAARPERDIVNEVDRYISSPGQALAYKIGQLKMLELRQRAERQLGGKLDLRKFHEVILGSGSVTLDVLETQVSAYIAGASQQ